MAQGDLTKLEGRLHTAVTSPRRRSRPGRYGRTEWPWDGPKRIYVSRSLSTISRPDYRQLLNESEVEDAIESKGYTVVYPETLRLRSQARLFAGADQIVGLSRSGMINCFFARSETRVLDIESFTNNVRQHAKLYASGKSTYSFAFGLPSQEGGQNIAFRNWSLPSEILNEALTWNA